MKKRTTGMSIATKITIIALAMIVISTATIGIFSFFLYKGDSIDYNGDKARSITDSVASAIDPVQFQGIISSNSKTEYWDEMKQTFDSAITRTGITYLYAADKNYTDTVMYVLTGLKPGDEPYADLGTKEPLAVFPEKMFEAIRTGKATSTDVYYAEGYGYLVSGYAPILDKNGAVIGIVGADLSVDSVMALANSFGIKIIIIALAFIIVCGLIAMWYVFRYVGRPIKTLTMASEKIALGDMDVDIFIRSKDEIGNLAVSFQNMVSSTQKQVELLEKMANGDLSLTMSPRCQNDIMGIAMQKMINNLDGMFSEIKNATSQVSSGSNQIAGGAQILAEGATEQAGAVEQLSGSISAVAMMTKENAEKANRAAVLGNTIKQNAETGSERMKQMLVAVNQISDASQEISKVIKVIDDIAFQTNILALNAAVEAARAGQHGKGFAVVAEEVRNLAAKSAQAAKETGGLISNSMEKAELGTRIAGETASSFTDIVTGINESSAIVDVIAKSSGEQSAAIETINKRIEQVAMVVQQNSATAEESAAASEEMSNQSNIMQDLIVRFKLKEDTGYNRISSYNRH